MDWKQCNLHTSARVFVLLADHMMLAQQRLPFQGAAEHLRTTPPIHTCFMQRVICK